MKQDDPIYARIESEEHPHGKWVLVGEDSEGDVYWREKYAEIRYFWRRFDRNDPSQWGFVCPCCLNVWRFSLSGMPGSFIAHVDPEHRLIRRVNKFNPPKIKEFAAWMEAEGGCFFKQTPKKRSSGADIL